MPEELKPDIQEEKTIRKELHELEKEQRRRRPWYRKLLKVLGWTLASLITLLIIVMCLIVWILTPERLTPLVNKYASEYLKADVKAERVELTLWKSFPEVRIDVKNLQLTSRTLQGQPDSVMQALPPDASQLATIGNFSGAINPWHLLHGVIALGDTKAEGVGLNLVAYSPTVNNYDIVPPSEEQKEPSEPMTLRFSNITLDAPGGIRYFDASTAMDVRLTHPSLTVTPTDGDDETLQTTFSSPLTFVTGGEAVLTDIPVTLRGPVKLKQKPTMSVQLPDYSITVAGFPIKLKAGLDLGDKPALTGADISVAPIKVLSLLPLIPQEQRDAIPELSQIDTDLSVGLNAHVECPWVFSSPNLPNVKVDFNVPPCYVSYRDPKGKELFRLNDLHFNGDFVFDGANPALSHLRIPVWGMQGDGINLALTAEASELLSDNPLLALTSQGSTDLSRWAKLIPLPDLKLQGTVDADASVRSRLNDIINLHYENIDADGSVQVRGLLVKVPVFASHLYSRLITLSLGNNMTARDSGHMVTGLLRARLDIDTLYCNVPGIEVGLRGTVLKAGATQGLLQKRAPGEITPLGVSFSTQRMMANSSTDTMKAKVRNLNLTGSITRYEGAAKSPLLRGALSADRLRYADPTLRVGTKKFSADLTAHLRPRTEHHAEATPKAGASSHNIDLAATGGIKELFKKWGITGNLSSSEVFLTHIMYPARMHLTGLNFDFSLDSVRLHRAHLITQDNELSLAGVISNLRPAMLGHTQAPIKLRLVADVQNLNVNQVAYNFELGSALASQRGYLARLSPEEENAMVRAAAAINVDTMQPVDTIPIILPRNIDARIALRAKRAEYTDLNFYNLSTRLLMNDGALSVDSLLASTDFGSAYMNLLYSSRNPERLNMALDLGFTNIDITKFLVAFPAITEQTPLISNLSGMVGAKLVGSFDLFPNMDIDIPSLNAVLNIYAADLRLQQAPLIRKIARMMLIRKKGDLDISDLDIQIALHDNILRLYPFKFGMEKYRFALLGENDFAQNMYYHLSVLKSPIPFKFGINVKGTFDHPKIRFGGAKYKENEAQEMENLIDAQRVNFVKAMRFQLRNLVNRAALSYADNAALDAYGQTQERENQDIKESTPYDNPVDMLSQQLQAPAVKALGKSSMVLKAYAEKIKAQEEANKKKKKKDKKKK